jgi:hypothetical protein
MYVKMNVRCFMLVSSAAIGVALLFVIPSLCSVADLGRCDWILKKPDLYQVVLCPCAEPSRCFRNDFDV